MKFFTTSQGQTFKPTGSFSNELQIIPVGAEVLCNIIDVKDVPSKAWDNGDVTDRHLLIIFEVVDEPYRRRKLDTKVFIYANDPAKQQTAIKKMTELDALSGGKLAAMEAAGQEIDLRAITNAWVRAAAIVKVGGWPDKAPTKNTVVAFRKPDGAVAEEDTGIMRKASEQPMPTATSYVAIDDDIPF